MYSQSTMSNMAKIDTYQAGVEGVTIFLLGFGSFLAIAGLGIVFMYTRKPFRRRDLEANTTSISFTNKTLTTPETDTDVDVLVK